MVIKTGTKVISIISIMLLILLLFLTYNQETLIYPGMKRPKQKLYEPFEEIDSSYYKKGSTNKLWVFFGGNGAIPIDYMEGMKLIKEDHSFFIITYPGYNGNKTKMSPETTYKTIDLCMKEMKLRGYKPTDINFMCYSMGCAIAIDWLYKTKSIIDKLFLLAPFWSLDEIVHSKYPFPKLIIKKLINHNWENCSLKHINQIIKITIIHGKTDETIHYSHGERLSKLVGSDLILTDDDHHTIRNMIPEIINDSKDT